MDQPAGDLLGALSEKFATAESLTDLLVNDAKVDTGAAPAQADASAPADLAPPTSGQANFEAQPDPQPAATTSAGNKLAQTLGNSDFFDLVEAEANTSLDSLMSLQLPGVESLGFLLLGREFSAAVPGAPAGEAGAAAQQGANNENGVVTTTSQGGVTLPASTPGAASSAAPTPTVPYGGPDDTPFAHPDAGGSAMNSHIPEETHNDRKRDASQGVDQQATGKVQRVGYEEGPSAESMLAQQMAAQVHAAAQQQQQQLKQQQQLQEGSMQAQQQHTHGNMQEGMQAQQQHARQQQEQQSHESVQAVQHAQELLLQMHQQQQMLGPSSHVLHQQQGPAASLYQLVASPPMAAPSPLMPVGGAGASGGSSDNGDQQRLRRHVFKLQALITKQAKETKLLKAALKQLYGKYQSTKMELSNMRMQQAAGGGGSRMGDLGLEALPGEVFRTPFGHPLPLASALPGTGTNSNPNMYNGAAAAAGGGGGGGGGNHIQAAAPLGPVPATYSGMPQQQGGGSMYGSRYPQQQQQQQPGGYQQQYQQGVTMYMGGGGGSLASSHANPSSVYTGGGPTQVSTGTGGGGIGIGGGSLRTVGGGIPQPVMYGMQSQQQGLRPQQQYGVAPGQGQQQLLPQQQPQQQQPYGQTPSPYQYQ